MFTLVGILLLVIGASLTFAVERQVEGVDLEVVGWIMMAGGVTALVFGIARFAGRMNGARAETGTQHDPPYDQPYDPDAAHVTRDPHPRDQHQPRLDRQSDDREWTT